MEKQEKIIKVKNVKKLSGVNIEPGTEDIYIFINEIAKIYNKNTDVFKKSIEGYIKKGLLHEGTDVIKVAKKEIIKIDNEAYDYKIIPSGYYLSGESLLDLELYFNEGLNQQVIFKWLEYLMNLKKRVK